MRLIGYLSGRVDLRQKKHTHDFEWIRSLRLIPWHNLRPITDC